MKVEEAVLGSLSQIVLMVCGRKATLNWSSRELRSCVKVEVAVLGSPSLIGRTVSADVNSNFNSKSRVHSVTHHSLWREVIQPSTLSGPDQ